MEEVITTRDLTKRYKKKIVVNKVNMHIEKGAVYGFIGENGAGKTTIIRMLSGLVRPTAGDYRLFGASSANGKARKEQHRMAAIVESPSVYQNFSAYDNLKLQCSLSGIKDLSVIDRVMEQVGLSYLKGEKKTAGKFSLGMRQRLGIAMALIGDPEFIILDEPMNGLDPEGIVEIRELIMKLNREKDITFLISSHILDELQKVATTFGFIHKGELVREISAEEIKVECKKSIDVFTENIENTVSLLKGNGIAADIAMTDNGYIRIFDDISINKLVMFLDGKGVEVLRIKSNEGNIEEFYLDMMKKYQQAERERNAEPKPVNAGGGQNA